MTANEVRLRNQVGRANRLLAEAQMRGGHCARLLRVVYEVALDVQVSFFTDDLDRVFVRADRAVRAQSVEHRAHRLCILNRELRIEFEAGVCDVVLDADSEMVLRRMLAKL